MQVIIARKILAYKRAVLQLSTLYQMKNVDRLRMFFVMFKMKYLWDHHNLYLKS